MSESQEDPAGFCRVVSEVGRWLQLRIPDKLTCLPFVPLSLGGRAEPQECSGLGAKSLTNTQRQLRSLLPLGGNGQSSTAVDLDEATEMVWLSSQE